MFPFRTHPPLLLSSSFPILYMVILMSFPESLYHPSYKHFRVMLDADDHHDDNALCDVWCQRTWLKMTTWIFLMSTSIGITIRSSSSGDVVYIQYHHLSWETREGWVSHISLSFSLLCPHDCDDHDDYDVMFCRRMCCSDDEKEGKSEKSICYVYW